MNTSFPISARAGSIPTGAASPRHDRAGVRFGTVTAAMVRTDEGESLGCIRNLSSRGLMVSLAHPPRRGAFVEIVTKTQSLVGQVKWANDCQAGIAMRGAIDVNALLRGERSPGGARTPAGRERTFKPMAPRRDVPMIAHNSHIIAQQLQLAATIAFGACAALLIASGVHDLLGDVLHHVSMGLPG